MVIASTDMSLEHRVALMTQEEQDAVLAGLDMEELAYDWGWNGRPAQTLPIMDDEPGSEFSLALALAGRGFGKALGLSTILPHMLPHTTLVGWTKLGDVLPGDTVFDEAGQPCKVLAVHDRMPDKAYRLTFSDGTTLDACDEHQWVTWTHRERKQYLRHHPAATEFPEDWPVYRTVRQDRWGNPLPGTGAEIRTTQQIVDTLTFGTRGDTNHCIPLAGPLNLPDQPLLLDPWLLGWWLGNGASRSGMISGHTADELEVRVRVTRAGYLTGYTPQLEGNAFSFNVLRMVTTLRALGVLSNKHVPDQYLWSSEPQRRAVLAGLMDSDGYCDKVSGHVEFCSTTQALANAVVQLARSLGEKPVIAEGRAKLNGVDKGPKWRVTWRPNSNPFSLARKAAVVRPAGSQAIRNRHRMIVAAEEIPPVPMRCLTVDSPNSMFLVGEGMIPTHNTLMGSQWIRGLDTHWAELGRDTSHLRVALLGRTAADVRDVMLEGPSGLLNIWPPSLRDRVFWTPSRRRVDLPGGGVCTCFSAEEPAQLRGPQMHAGWGDEIATYKQIRTSEEDASAWDNLRIAVRLGTRPQILATTTPKRVPILRQLLSEAATQPKKFLIRRGKTYDNKYLSTAYLDVLVSLYGGSNLGRQELEGEMLDDVDGAMTSEAIINATRVTSLPEGIPWIKLVSVDPSVAERPNDECGIVVIYISRTWPVLRRHAFIVDDLSVRASPTIWSDRVIKAAVEHDATIIAETNQGANLVFQMLRMAADKAGVPMPPMKEVWASKAKAVRAEPVGAAYARRRIHHLNVLADLETQATTWTPNDAYSPDRLDALTQGCAAGLFPEALTTSGLGAATLYSVANQHIPITRQTALVRATGMTGGWDRR